ncbi:MAG: alpha/beta fold hydrolase [Chloroflexi bacterium]|nr:alpha/beta fold hydrolase [Chloroflexota bacterium]
MPYVSNDGVRIHYHVEGEGPPLVLQHGTSQSLEDWYSYGYVQGLKGDYQLVLVDHRGHGRSGKPHDSKSYGLDKSVSDIVAILDDLNIPRAHYFGYSMGGSLAFGVAKYAPDRFHSLIIGAGHPYERSMEAARELLRRGIEEFLAPFESAMAEPIEPKVKARLLSNDVEALIALTKDRPNLEELLPTMTVPCLMYVGERDSLFSDVERAARQLPNGTFFSLPGLGHYEGYAKSELVLPQVKKFLAEMS